MKVYKWCLTLQCSSWKRARLWVMNGYRLSTWWILQAGRSCKTKTCWTWFGLEYQCACSCEKQRIIWAGSPAKSRPLALEAPLKAQTPQQCHRACERTPWNDIFENAQWQGGQPCQVQPHRRSGSWQSINGYEFVAAHNLWSLPQLPWSCSLGYDASQRTDRCPGPRRGCSPAGSELWCNCHVLKMLSDCKWGRLSKLV